MSDRNRINDLISIHFVKLEIRTCSYKYKQRNRRHLLLKFFPIMTSVKKNTQKNKTLEYRDCSNTCKARVCVLLLL